MADRIDWPKIKAMLGVEYSTPFVFILPNSGRQLLNALIHRLTFEATFRDFDYDFSDWDDVQKIVASTETGLMQGVNMNELLAALEAIRAAIANKDCPDITLSTCNSLENGGFPEYPPETIPEFVQQPSTTPWPSQSQTYIEYRCSAAHKYVDAVRNMIENFMDMMLQQSPYSWIYDAMTNEEFGGPVYSVLIAIYNFLSANVYALLRDDLLAIYDDISSDLVCAIFTAETEEEAKDHVRLLIDSYPMSYVQRWLLYAIIIDSSDVTPLWEQDAVDVTGYETADCSGCGLSLVVYGWSKADGTDVIVTEPAELSYTGIGWIGGTVWSCVQANNQIKYGSISQNTTRVEWSVKAASDSASGSLSVILDDDGGTSVTELVASMSAGQEYSGTLQLTAVQALNSLASQSGVKLDSWSIYATN